MSRLAPTDCAGASCLRLTICSAQRILLPDDLRLRIERAAPVGRMANEPGCEEMTVLKPTPFRGAAQNWSEMRAGQDGNDIWLRSPTRRRPECRGGREEHFRTQPFGVEHQRFAVPRYFFHMSDGQRVEDREGELFSTLFEAMENAQQVARELARNASPAKIAEMSIIVEDENGHELFAAPLSGKAQSSDPRS